MNVVYALDHKFIKDGNSIYSIEFNNEFFAPYKEVFGDIKVVSRFVKRSISHLDSVDVDYTPLPNISTLLSFFGVRKKVKRVLTNIIKSSDLVIARVPSEIGLMSISIAKELSKPILVEVAGDAYEILKYYGGIKASFYAPIMKKRVLDAINGANFVVYVTKRYLQLKYPHKKIALVESISNVQLVVASNRVIKNRFKRDKNTITFGVIANIDMKFKGIDILLEAFAKYKSLYPSSILKIVGSGDISKYTNTLNRLNIKDSVIFEGVIWNKKQKYKWLDEIDIYIQPSLTEGLPRALIEAMGRGCIVIASDVGGVSEILDKSFLFKSGDSKDLYKKMLNVAYSFDIAIKNRDLVASLYSKEILYKKRVNFYERIKDTLAST